jgi:F-type H+-transporting ATPase subunit b
VLIDWFTVGAQALNFIVLVGLMKHFLYRPVLDAIDAREKTIADALADAQAKQTEARKERDDFRRRNDDLDRQRTALLAEAAKDAEAERQRLLGQARQAAEAQGARQQAALAAEARRVGDALVHRTQQEVFAVAGRALADLASADLEAHIAEVFVHRLRALDGPDKERLAQALESAPGPALVRSTFDLAEGPRAAIRQAVEDTFGAPAALHFETAPQLVGGIELSAGGQKIAWSIAAYLASLQAGVGEILGTPAAGSR